MPEDMSEYMPEDMSDRMPEDMSEYMPEDMPDRMPEDMSDRVPEDMPDRMPEDLPDRMPEDMPDHMPEDMPDRMSNRMSEDMSDRMPEDLPVRKCINVMVGITRSKVICCFLVRFILLIQLKCGFKNLDGWGLEGFLFKHVMMFLKYPRIHISLYLEPMISIQYFFSMLQHAVFIRMFMIVDQPLDVWSGHGHTWSRVAGPSFTLNVKLGRGPSLTRPFEKA